MIATRRWAFPCAALVLATACNAPQTPSELLRVSPPPGWEIRLARERAARDADFRTAPWSPLPASVRETFGGLDYYPLDAAYYFVGEMRRAPEPERLTMVTTRGETREAERLGRLHFELAGHDLVLNVYRMLDADPASGGDDDRTFVPFADGTTGDETYPAGRYVDLRGPAGGPYVLDFNRAYNPFCAYGEPERYACPRTPAENRLPIPIPAGERGFLHDPGPAP